jgi:hypothetical protein
MVGTSWSWRSQKAQDSVDQIMRLIWCRQRERTVSGPAAVSMTCGRLERLPHPDLPSWEECRPSASQLHDPYSDRRRRVTDGEHEGIGMTHRGCRRHELNLSSCIESRRSMRRRCRGLIVRKGILDHLDHSRGLMERRAIGEVVMIEAGVVQRRVDGRDGLIPPVV